MRAVSVPAVVDLTGTTWLLDAVRVGDELEAVVEGATAHLELAADGRLHGSTGCNTFGGRWRAADAALALEVGPMTMRACPPGVDRQERAVLAALALVVGRRLDADGTLVLLDDEGAPVARLQPGISSLAGTRWSTTGIHDGRDAVVSVAGEPPVALEFRSDGTVRVEHGGDAADTSYLAGDGWLSVDAGPLEELDHPRLGAALRAVTTWRVHGEGLELRDAEGGARVLGRLER